MKIITPINWSNYFTGVYHKGFGKIKQKAPQKEDFLRDINRVLEFCFLRYTYLDENKRYGKFGEIMQD